ncbi:hypothetical protein [Janthinobacterium sp. CAN_S7]|uniref:hypothetical protein n=1 Tax=Janthinobacterium sp. CAN_S7 TaxID=3071704 RepID=UPI00319E50BF
MNKFKTIFSNIWGGKSTSVAGMGGLERLQNEAQEPTFAPLQPELGQQLFGANKTKPATAKGSKAPAYQLVGTLTELHQLAANPPSTKTTILLTGELVLLSDTEVSKLDNYSRQTDRIAKSISNFTSRTTSFTLKVWLHKNVIELQSKLNHHRFCCAIDQYLRYGKKQKETMHLITGYHGSIDTIIQIFTFKQGNLTAIEEKVLPSHQQARFNADYTEMLNALRRSGAPVTIAAPLNNPEGEQYSYMNEDIYKKPIRYILTDESAAPSILAAHGIPTIALLVAIIVSVAAIAIPYERYNQATEQFKKVAASIPKDDLAFGWDQNKTMQARRLFLTEPRPQEETIRFLRSITGALSREGVTIINIELNEQKQNPDTPDIAIVIQAKRNPGESPLEQARPLIDSISNRIGIQLHLAHNGHQDRSTSAGKFIQYNIEGNFKGKQ